MDWWFEVRRWAEARWDRLLDAAVELRHGRGRRSRSARSWVPAAAAAAAMACAAGLVGHYATEPTTVAIESTAQSASPSDVAFSSTNGADGPAREDSNASAAGSSSDEPSAVQPSGSEPTTTGRAGAAGVGQNQPGAAPGGLDDGATEGEEAPTGSTAPPQSGQGGDEPTVIGPIIAGDTTVGPITISPGPDGPAVVGEVPVTAGASPDDPGAGAGEQQSGAQGQRGPDRTAGPIPPTTTSGAAAPTTGENAAGSAGSGNTATSAAPATSGAPARSGEAGSRSSSSRTDDQEAGAGDGGDTGSASSGATAGGGSSPDGAGAQGEGAEAADAGAAGAATDAIFALEGVEGFDLERGGNVEDGEVPEAVESPNVPGRQAVKMAVPTGGKRSEVTPTDAAQDIRAGEHLFFGYSAFLPDTFPVDAQGFQVIWQLHDGGTNTSPPVALEVQQGKLWLANVGELVQDLGPVTAGENLSVQMEIEFALGGGSVSVWRDGQEVVTDFQPPQGTMIDEFNYLKTGLYRDDGDGDAPATELFLNDLRVADSLAGVSGLAGAPAPSSEVGQAAGVATSALLGGAVPIGFRRWRRREW